MSIINRVPLGLQDIVGAVSQGDNPNDLVNTVQGQFDILPLWLAERVAQTRTSVQINSRGDVSDIDVPDGEVWIPFSMAFGIPGVVTAGDIFSLTPSLMRFPLAQSSSTQHRLETTAVITAANAGDIHMFDYTFPFQIAYDAGSKFRITVSQYTQIGTDNSLEFSVHYWRLNK